MRDGQLRLPDLRPLLLKGLDILCIVAPLSAAVAGETLSRGSYREVSADIAVAGLAMLFMQFALSGRFKFVSGNIGIDSLMRFHQMAARLVLGLLIMHPFLLVTQRPGCCNFRGTDCHIPRQATGGIAAVTFGMHHVLNVGASRTYPLTPSHPHRHSSSSSPGCVRRGRRVKSDQQRAPHPKAIRSRRQPIHLRQSIVGCPNGWRPSPGGRQGVWTSASRSTRCLSGQATANAAAPDERVAPDNGAKNDLRRFS